MDEDTYTGTQKIMRIEYDYELSTHPTYSKIMSTRIISILNILK
jgi:hypothetical protein